MTKKNKQPIIEGEVVDKTKGSEKFISERSVALIFVVFGVIVGGYFAYPTLISWFTDPVEIAQDADSVPVLEQRLAAIENRVSGIENTPGQANPAAGLEERIAALESAVTEFPAGGATPTTEDPRIAEMAAEIATLKTRLDNLAASQGTYSPGYSSALAQLAPPLYKSAPYPGELEQVRIYILDMPALDQVRLSPPVGVLETYAGTGIVGMAQLEAEFFNAVLEALRMEGLDPDAGWWARTWAKIKGQVVIRRTDGSDGSDLEAAITNAEAFLDMGEASSALEVILALPEADRNAFKDWIYLAGQRVAALQAFEVLTSHLSRSARGNR